MQVPHFQSNIAQIIGEILRCSFRQRCHQNPLALFHTLTAQLNRFVDLILERLESNFWIEKSGRTNNLLDDERRTRRVRIEFFRRFVSAGNVDF